MPKNKRAARHNKKNPGTKLNPQYLASYRDFWARWETVFLLALHHDRSADPVSTLQGLLKRWLKGEAALDEPWKGIIIAYGALRSIEESSGTEAVDYALKAGLALTNAAILTDRAEVIPPIVGKFPHFARQAYSIQAKIERRKNGKKKKGRYGALRSAVELICKTRNKRVSKKTIIDVFDTDNKEHEGLRNSIEEKDIIYFKWIDRNNRTFQYFECTTNKEKTHNFSYLQKLISETQKKLRA